MGLPVRSVGRIDLRGFWALLQWELRNLARSWVVRLWLLLTALAGLFLVVVSANPGDADAASTSQLFTAALSGYLTFGVVVFIILSASSVASEREVVSDSILCRSVTRYHYILSKLASLVLTFLVLYLLVVVPMSLLMGRYNPGSDLSAAGVAYAILSVGMVLATLATLGVAISSLLKNTILAVVIVTLIWLGLGFIFSFLDIAFLSPADYLENVPQVVAGDYSSAEQWQFVGGFAGLVALFSALAVLAFQRKDL